MANSRILSPRSKSNSLSAEREAFEKAQVRLAFCLLETHTLAAGQGVGQLSDKIEFIMLQAFCVCVYNRIAQFTILQS